MQITDWEKRFKIYRYIEGLIPRIYEEVSHQTLTKDLKRCSTEEDTPVAKKYVKGCLTSSLVIRETQIKTVRYHHTSIKWPYSKDGQYQV